MTIGQLIPSKIPQIYRDQKVLTGMTRKRTGWIGLDILNHSMYILFLFLEVLLLNWYMVWIPDEFQRKFIWFPVNHMWIFVDSPETQMKSQVIPRESTNIHMWFTGNQMNFRWNSSGIHTMYQFRRSTSWNIKRIYMEWLRISSPIHPVLFRVIPVNTFWSR